MGPVIFTAWDIETDTSGGFGLDPNHGGITSIAAGVYSLAPDGDLAELHQFYACAGTGMSEAEVLGKFDRWLNVFAPLGDLVGWNSSCFDAPFCFRRAEILGLRLDLFLSFDPDIVPKYDPTPGFAGGYRHRWHGVTGFDLAFDRVAFTRAWCDDNGVKYSLKPVAQHFGLEPIEVARDRVHELTADELRAYNLSDVRATAWLAGRAWLGEAMPAPSTAAQQ